MLSATRALCATWLPYVCVTPRAQTPPCLHLATRTPGHKDKSSHAYKRQCTEAPMRTPAYGPIRTRTQEPMHKHLHKRARAQMATDHVRVYACVHRLVCTQATIGHLRTNAPCAMRRMCYPVTVRRIVGATDCSMHGKTLQGRRPCAYVPSTGTDHFHHFIRLLHYAASFESLSSGKLVSTDYLLIQHH